MDDSAASLARIGSPLPEPPLAAATLLAGVATSVSQLRNGLSTVRPAVRVVGCLLPQADGAADPGCPVLGGFDELERVLEQHPVDQVLLSLPLAMSGPLEAMVERLERSDIAWRFMPTLADQLAGRTHAPGGPRPSFGRDELDVARLINRQPRPLDDAAIRRALQGKRVLITGAGGSIGSELARIVCRFDPAALLLVERSENALFEIDRQIKRLHPALERAALLHDVTDADATLDLLDRDRPDVIFHAAAHKHVPMMEGHPAAAVENNFFGTRSVADAADRFGVERFVMISTDKAVNPSSVMGATKRLAELYIQHLNRTSRTIYAMVRFGNVLGSACSVLPIWGDQLSHGGPITVTHPQMTRYFMTIPEAAGLVLQAGAYADGGEVFLLDMGEPVNILGLARRFVRLRGFEPDVDIEVRITGVRPGEKLFEELAYSGEDKRPTPHPSVAIWATDPPADASMAAIVTAFERLRRRRGVGRDAIVAALRSSLPEMTHAAAG